MSPRSNCAKRDGMQVIEQDMSGEPVCIPVTIRRYADYLRIRTKATPDTSINGDQAELRLQVGDNVLLLVFGYREKQWSLRSGEINSGDERIATFRCGELAHAASLMLARP
jgi:hypothetical protein